MIKLSKIKSIFINLIYGTSFITFFNTRNLNPKLSDGNILRCLVVNGILTTIYKNRSYKMNVNCTTNTLILDYLCVAFGRNRIGRNVRIQLGHSGTSSNGIALDVW